MSRMVWFATCLAAVLIALAGPASAQYRGYGYDYDSGPNYFMSSPAYDPFYQERRGPYPDERRDSYYPDDRRGGPPPESAYGYDRDQTPYTDPAYGGREPDRQGGGYGGGGYGGGGYDLGENANQRTMVQVANPTREPAGTIVIDTASRHLYLVERDGQALQYGIGVGREGFEWKGTAHVQRKAEWPGWTPPAEMLKRRPDLPVHMDGGIENPLGARALYLFNGKGDTGFRIHGTNEPETIGKAVSSGCIRMMNADVIDLYQRVPVGTRVVVL